VQTTNRTLLITMSIGSIVGYALRPFADEPLQAIRIATPRTEYEAGERVEVAVSVGATSTSARLLVIGEIDDSEKPASKPKTMEYKLEIDPKTRTARTILQFDAGGKYRLRAEATDAAGRTLAAQRTVQVHAPHFLDGRIDAILRQWWVSTSKITSCYAEFNRTIEDQGFEGEHAQGRAHFLHPNLARLDVFRQEGKQIEMLETFILTGKGEIWQYKPRLEEKQIVIWKLPPEMAQQEAVDEGPLPFLLGAKPEKIKARYKLKLAKEDEKQIRLTVYPRWDEDKQNFLKVELWLNKSDFLPAKLAFIEPNYNTVTYEFTGIWPNIELDRNVFAPRRIKGWTVVEKQVRSESADSAAR
jgi:TIGR03009 family protein